MPDDNVWLAQRHAEQHALARLLKAMQSAPGRASARRRMRRCPRRPGSADPRPHPPDWVRARGTAVVAIRSLTWYFLVEGTGFEPATSGL
jgi:hypothetical protein